jgi:hypothetical protein
MLGNMWCFKNFKNLIPIALACRGAFLKHAFFAYMGNIRGFWNIILRKCEKSNFSHF